MTFLKVFILLVQISLKVNNHVSSLCSLKFVNFFVPYKWSVVNFGFVAFVFNSYFIHFFLIFCVGYFVGHYMRLFDVSLYLSVVANCSSKSWMASSRKSKSWWCGRNEETLSLWKMWSEWSG
jgi:hypothetical protein